ncbi:MAG: hypothetical protein D6725_07035 [Planctomycetota bacterium]|nr:MAG: hypothetical protein D6725_07035 [Planctomycetota bacterium]
MGRFSATLPKRPKTGGGWQNSDCRHNLLLHNDLRFESERDVAHEGSTDVAILGGGGEIAS